MCKFIRLFHHKSIKDHATSHNRLDYTNFSNIKLYISDKRLEHGIQYVCYKICAMPLKITVNNNLLYVYQN